MAGRMRVFAEPNGLGKQQFSRISCIKIKFHPVYNYCTDFFKPAGLTLCASTGFLRASAPDNTGFARIFFIVLMHELLFLKIKNESPAGTHRMSPSCPCLPILSDISPL